MNEKDRREILKNMTPEQLAKANELYDQIKRFAEPEIDYENMTMDKINEYLLRHGYDPEQVGLRGKILADALIENVDLRAEVARLTALVNLKNDALDSYAEFYGRAAGMCGLPDDALPGAETDAIILQRLAEHDEIARLTELQRAASEFIGYIKAGNNAKAHLQMLFLEVLINEESKNGAKK